MHDIPGASVFVAVGDEVVEAVYGVINTRTRVPVTPDAVFQVQSVTKVFTAGLVMQLVDERLVNLDDPVRCYMPEFRTASSGTRDGSDATRPCVLLRRDRTSAPRVLRAAAADVRRGPGLVGLHVGLRAGCFA